MLFSPLASERLNTFLSTTARAQLQAVEVYQETDSTNTRLWDLQQQDIHRAVCLAESQTAGRGRRGQPWVSPPGGNLYLSLLWPLPVDAPANGLTIATGLSLISSLNQFGLQDLQIKWPNDILHQRQKLAGILVESRIGHSRFVVIGIGLNIAMSDQVIEQIPQPVTSLQQLTDQLPCRHQLAATIINDMLDVLPVFTERGLLDFLPAWSRYDALFHQPIEIISDNGRQRAIAAGINVDGELRCLNGERIDYLSSSHVSIRFAS